MFLVVLFLVCETKGKDLFDNEDQEEGIFEKSKGYLASIISLVLERWNWFDPYQTVNIAQALVSNFDVKTMVTDLTQANEEIRGLEFDKFDEKNGNRVLKGVDLKEFEIVIKTIANSNEIPEEFVQEILLSKHIDSNAFQKQKFIFEEGHISKIWYCAVTTKKVSGNKIDLAMAFYNLNFKMSDRMKHHSKARRFFGIKYWTDEWTTSEPRKLSMSDQTYFGRFLKAKAIIAFVEDHQNMITVDSYDRKDEI